MPSDTSPGRPLDIRDSLRLAARAFPGKDCVVLEDQRVSYGQLHDRIERLAAAMSNLGIGKGARVGYLQVNAIAFVECLYACLHLGAILVPLNYRLRARELDYIVNQSGVSALFVGERYVDVVRALAAPALTTCICLERAAPGMVAYDSLFEDTLRPAPAASLEGGDTALILYTSGTTGLPKGAMISLQALHHLALSVALSLKLDHHDRVLAGGPLYHIGTVGYLIPSLYVGATWVMLPQFDAGQALAAIARERLTVCWFAPTMLNFMSRLEEPRTTDVSSLRLIQYGGAPMPAPVLEAASALFGCRFMQIYGMTEAAPQTFLDPDDHGLDARDPRRGRLASIGRPAPNVDLRIVDAAGRDVAPGEIGEIICRCATMMSGYWDKPAETAAAIRAGWLHTGDLARADADGFIYLVDRIKDMIIRGGENIYPAEIERVLYEHPAIAEAAVVGAPDPAWGERVKAVVVLHPGMTATAEALIQHCQDRLASYKKPSEVEFVGALPRNAGGKVLKQELRTPPRPNPVAPPQT
jgi:fatty-acyl-CoA synthase